MKKKYKLQGLSCASCAAKMEDKISKLDGVKKANVSFMTENLKLDIEDEADLDKILDEASDIVTSIEANTTLKR